MDGVKGKGAKRKGRRVPANNTEAAIRKLERMHDKVAGLLHVADQQDHEIGRAARAHHDKINSQIERLAAELEQQYPNVDPQTAQRYGELLEQRKQLQGAILRHRPRRWEEGHQPPV